MQRHLHEAPPSFSSLGVAAPKEVEDFILRALAKSPEDRFTSMEELLDAGDRAFSQEPAPSVDEPAPADAKPETRLEPPRASTSITAQHATITVIGLALIVAVGYAAEGRHNPLYWVFVAGWSAYPTLVAFLAGALLLPRFVEKRPLAAWWLAILPALFGALGTITGLNFVASAVLRYPLTGRFVFFGVGVYEIGASHFLGYSLSALLCASLSVSQMRTSKEREALALGAVLLVFGAVAALAGAPGGALTALCAAALVLPGGEIASLRRESARWLAGLCAVGFAAATAMARLEAREAVLWATGPTRAERAQEIIAAAGERRATIACVLLTLAMVAWAGARRLRRAGVKWQERRELAPRGALSWALVFLTSTLALGDLVTELRYAERREELRTALASQLDPPSGDSLDAKDFAPRGAAGLQVARDVIAINGEPVAKLLAVESSEGALNLGRDLGHALAESAQKATPEAPDLSISVDREVPYSVVARVFAVARRAGAREVELLFTRGTTPPASLNAPPEVYYVLASDFVALPVALSDDGFEAGNEETFGAVAPRLLEAGRAAKGALRLKAEGR